MFDDHHDSFIVGELLKLSPDDRARFRTVLRAHSDLAEEVRIDLDDIHRDFAVLAIRARYLDDDPIWRAYGAVAEAARLKQVCDELEAAAL